MTTPPLFLRGGKEHVHHSIIGRIHTWPPTQHPSVHIDDMLMHVPSVKRPAMAIQYAKQFGMVQEGDNVVVVTRETSCDVLTTDFASMKICTVP
jgi:hypothetical protein